jgi:hypothetical protein
MYPSPGFLIVASIGALIVVGPFVYALVKLCRVGQSGRLVSLLSALLVLGMGLCIFKLEPIAGTVSFEENAVLFLGLWGFMFYFLAGVVVMASFLKRKLLRMPANH